ncbi:uncharacterized protein MELLADRAFT_124020 [Melampsora larici-populina 98AG31]|uniref:Secreted protein n=1 Tax=Melampsora larici-populina (strain 98AG31 / pathotype 3-4-7) TaxID=747676 RepID=F4S2E5_MELLP|nr:uncharacterized protein MELLADRAFT_124020 [Melampsora larici-populina 98AG31]EGG01163.1 secreted protein [Melampsora larici-populina 98AG31]
MNFAFIILSVLVSFQAIMTLPTTLMPRLESQIGKGGRIDQRCAGFYNGGFVPGFSYDYRGYLNVPFTSQFYYSINQNYGFDSCNGFGSGQVVWGQCSFPGQCQDSYNHYTGLLGGLLGGVGGLVSGVGQAVGGLVSGVGGLVGGLGNTLGLLSDQELKADTNQI